jgi:hypothetical protein
MNTDKTKRILLQDCSLNDYLGRPCGAGFSLRRTSVRLPRVSHCLGERAEARCRLKSAPQYKVNIIGSCFYPCSSVAKCLFVRTAKLLIRFPGLTRSVWMTSGCQKSSLGAADRESARRLLPRCISCAMPHLPHLRRVRLHDQRILRRLLRLIAVEGGAIVAELGPLQNLSLARRRFPQVVIGHAQIK